MSAAVVAPAEAIAYLCFCIGWHGGYVPVYLRGSAQATTWLEARTLGVELARRVERWDGRDSKQVELGLPESHRENGGPATSTVLWAWLESKESASWAARLQPLPAVVLKIGASCRRLCLWPLSESLSWISVENANKRLAYALHAPQKYATPEKLRIPVPGTCIREGRTTPAPVVATRFELETFEREQVVGQLKDPPAPYMQRLREGKIAGRS